MHIIFLFPLPLLHLDKDIHRGHDSLSHRPQHQPYLNSQEIPHALQHSGAGAPYSQLQSPALYLRRGSVEYGSSSEGSHGSPTTAEHSIPSSAASSNVHLPLDNLSMQQPHSLSYNVSPDSSVATGSCFLSSFSFPILSFVSLPSFLGP
jgi:hypothetical protein